MNEYSLIKQRMEETVEKSDVRNGYKLLTIPNSRFETASNKNVAVVAHYSRIDSHRQPRVHAPRTEPFTNLNNN